VAAARFYKEAFEEEPRLADDLQGKHRYHAVRAAVRAACGQGLDAGGLGDGERAQLRKDALQWLTADLAAWTWVANHNVPQAHAEVKQRLGGWQQDAELAGVRDASALERLPAAERDAWRKLWDDIARLLKGL
jgi:hypothetical protein